LNHTASSRYCGTITTGKFVGRSQRDGPIVVVDGGVVVGGGFPSSSSTGFW
jgi:hypothetical protein